MYIVMDFETVYNDPQTVHASSQTWQSLQFLDQRLRSSACALLHSSTPTHLQAELLSEGTKQDFLTVLTGPQGSGKTTAMCLYALTMGYMYSEVHPSVLILTPDDVRMRHVASVLSSLSPHSNLVSITSCDRQIAVYSLTPLSISRLTSHKETFTRTLLCLILDDSEDCLSVKEWRALIGSSVIGPILHKRGMLAGLTCLFAQREWKDTNSKFIQELEVNLVKEYRCSFPKREIVSVPYPSSYQYHYVIDRVEDAIVRLFSQDRVVMHPPVLIITRDYSTALSVKSRMESMELQTEVLDVTEQGSTQMDSFSRFVHSNLRYLVIYPEVSRRYQTLSPGSVILIGVPMTGETPNLPQLTKELWTGVRPGGEGNLVLVLRSEEEATWLRQMVKVEMRPFPPI